MRLTALLAAACLGGCASFPLEPPATEDPRPVPGGTVPQLPPGPPPAPERPAPVPAPAPAPMPAPMPAPAPVPEPAPSYHPAGEALVEQARREVLMGSDALAGATLERALRIDGNNPWIWIELGYLRLSGGQQAAATSMARKALSLASRDPVARAAAEDLLRQSGAGY
jgi:outer membrane biosynthesis protein TonB